MRETIIRNKRLIFTCPIFLLVPTAVQWLCKYCAAKELPALPPNFKKFLLPWPKPFCPFPFDVHKGNGIISLLFQIMSLVLAEHFLFQIRHAKSLSISLQVTKFNLQPISDKPRHGCQPVQCPEGQFFSLQAKDVICTLSQMTNFPSCLWLVIVPGTINYIKLWISCFILFFRQRQSQLCVLTLIQCTISTRQKVSEV